MQRSDLTTDETVNVTVRVPAAAALRAALCDDPLLDKAEGCAYCHCAYPTLWKLVKDGELAPGRYIRGKLFWLKSELDAFIASRPRQGTLETPPGRQLSGNQVAPAEWRQDGNPAAVWRRAGKRGQA